MNVIRLISTRNENGFRVTDNVGNGGVLRSIAIRDDQRGHGIGFAEAVDVRIVIIVSVGAKNQKVSTISLATQPAKSFVEVIAPAHHGNPGHWLG